MPSVVPVEQRGSFTPLWRLHRGGHDASCELVELPFGYEGRFLMDGRFLYSYTFKRPDEVVAWAGERQAKLWREGWMPEV